MEDLLKSSPSIHWFHLELSLALQPDVHPGNCWAFQGSHGYLVIRLSMRIVPSAFSLEHIPKALSPTGTISSAPRQFTVYVSHANLQTTLLTQLTFMSAIAVSAIQKPTS